MDHLKAFGIKYAVVAAITFSIYGIFNHVSLWRLFLISIIVAAVTYAGDVFLLPRISRVLATVGDFALYTVLYFGLAFLLINGSMGILIPSLAAAFLATMAEMLFHVYMDEKVFKTKESTGLPYKLQAEFGEEMDAKSVTKNNQTYRHKNK